MRMMPVRDGNWDKSDKAVDKEMELRVGKLVNQFDEGCNKEEKTL